MLLNPDGAPLGKLPPQAWMTRPATRAVMDALTAEGDAARFIGGCVRDALVDRPVKDIDIATPLSPETVMARLEAAGLKAVPTGLRHGTVTAVADGQPAEITTLRRDVRTDGRRAEVAFTDDWEADARRRDFTMNALSATIDGDVYDYTDGLADLSAGRVRFIGPPEDRIREDYLRILRFFRFFAHYGRSPADPAALTACRRLADHLTTLAAERIRDELLRILDSPDPGSVVKLMQGEGVLPVILPEAAHVDRLRMLAWLETSALNMASVGPDPLRRLAALVAVPDAEAGEALGGRLRLSRAWRRRLATLTAPPVEPGPEMPGNERRRWLYRLGADRFRDLVLLTWAARRALDPGPASGTADAWTALLTAADTWEGAAFPLRGRDVTEAGVPRGPAVGRYLNAVKAWWEDGGCRADRAACLDYLATLVADDSEGAPPCNSS